MRALLVRSLAMGLMLSTLVVAEANAQAYSVALEGSDANPGSFDAPWGTISYAVSQLRAGDTLYIRGGTYTGHENTIDSESNIVRSGTSWENAITIAGHPSETVILQPPDGREGIRLAQSAPHYLIFEDFIIDMANNTVGATSSGPSGIHIGKGAHHNRFLRLEIKNNQGNGIEISDYQANSPFNEILHCSIHDNGQAPGANTGYGAYVTSSDNLFDGNDVYNNGGYGLHFYDDSGEMNVARNVVRRNKIHHNGIHGGSNYGIVVAWGDGNLIYNNAIYGNLGGILVYTGSTHTGIYRNFLLNNIHDGIVTDESNTATIAYNVIYRSGEGILDNNGDSTIMNNTIVY